MTPIIILFIVLGWISYWIVKVPATIKGTSPVETVGQFLKSNWREITLSAFGVLLLVFGGDEIPADIGKITGPLTAYMAGGAVPSVMMNISALFAKK